MFKTKEPNPNESPETCTLPVKVLQLDFKPSKAESQLESWLETGWRLRGTESVLSDGQTIFLLAFLEHP